MNNPKIEIVQGNLLNQDVDVIVNTWNRNIIPWWLLLPQGVSGQIKKYGGVAPFQEIGFKPLKLGQAILTSAGRLPYKAIIHVAGINMLWRAGEESIRNSTKNAMNIVNEESFTSVAFPIIGAGSGGFEQGKALSLMLDELNGCSSSVKVIVVIHNSEKVRERGLGI